MITRLHQGRRQGERGGRAAQERRLALGARRRRRPPRSRRRAPSSSARSGTGCRASSASSSPRWRSSRPPRRADPAAAPAARRRARLLALPRGARRRSPSESRGSIARARRGAVAGREALARVTRGDRRAARARPRTRRGSRKPLRQFLQTIDDRERSVEDDPSAEARAPPAPDKTRLQGGPGLHRHGGPPQLRLLADARRSTPSTRSATCCASRCWPAATAPAYQAKPDRGPQIRAVQLVARPVPARRDHRPTPPARPPPRRSRSEAARARAPSARGEPRRRRRPRGASRKPGQRDLSKPQIALPPEIQDLLDGLPTLPDGTSRRRRDGSSASTRSPPNTLLDYLLVAMSRRPAASIVASPVLVGAVTLLIAMRRGVARRARPTRACRSCRPTT